MKKIFKAWTASWTVLLLVLSLTGTSAFADRIKDLTTVAAMRSNQLIGYGLVVGLQGTGDGSDVSFTAQSMKTLLNRLGVSMEGPLSDFETATSSGKLDIKNVAAVMVTAELPTAARIPSGATVERVVDNPFDKADRIVLNVRESDFTTTNAIVSAINGRFGADVARALDGVSITLQAPQDLTQRVAFMSMIENMDVMPGEPPARVVINAKTGTVVISRNVRVTAAAVTHGTISVAISATNEISQPGAFSQGQTAAVQNADVTVSEPNKPMFLFQPGVDLRQIVDAVNQVGASPSSLIAILEALKSSGSLRAELVII